MPEMAPQRARGGPRGGKSGRPRRNRAEMERLRDACRQARLQGLTDREAVAWLASRGFDHLDAKAYRKTLGASQALVPRERLRRFALEAPRMHADSILSLQLIREEGWRQYYRVRDAPRSDEPGGEDWTEPERHRANTLAAATRVRILSTLKDIEPLISAYVEAGVVRERMMDAEAAGRPAFAGAAAPSAPAPALRPRFASDPDRPGTITLVPAT